MTNAALRVKPDAGNPLCNSNSILKLALGVATFWTFAAGAEVICYNGFSTSPNSDLRSRVGFTSDSSVPVPSGVSTYVMPPQNSGNANPLSLPSSFAGVESITQVFGGEHDGSVRMSAPSAAGNFGSKVMTLADNCQSRRGQLHFRFLIRADQGALDGRSAQASKYPAALDQYWTCGLVWAVDDYTKMAVTDSSVRYVSPYGISSDHVVANANRTLLTFSRGFMVGLSKESKGRPILVLYVWGSSSTTLSSCRSIELVRDVEGGKTYICHVRLDIDHFSDGADRLMAFAQPIDDYDTNAFNYPLVRSVRADVIDGSTDLYANLVLGGPNDASNLVCIDEIALATEAGDLSFCDFADAPVSDILAYDGFSCETNEYEKGSYQVSGKMVTSPISTKNIFGFETQWGMFISKGVPVFGGEGTGLSLPACYAAAGVVSRPGTSITFSAAADQAMYLKRAFNDETLALQAGEVLYMRFLLKATDEAIRKLTQGPGTDGTLDPGTVGVAGNVNYFGAGIADCSTQIETGNSMAPALCRRANSCFITLTKGEDYKVGLYLNLLTSDGDTPVAHKIADVAYEGTGAAAHTYFCFVRIEVGTGAGGKERISGFAADIEDITDKWGRNWFPTDVDNTIEHEIIGSSAYPKHAVVGGKAHPGFAFDEFALSLNAPMPFTWAKRPRGFLLLFN